MKKSVLLGCVSGLTFLCLTSAFGQESQIHLKSGIVSQEMMIPVQKANRLNLNNNRVGDQLIVILKFKKIPNAEEKTKLEEAGISLLDYQPDLAYTASLPANFNLNKLNEFGLTHLIEIQPKFKLSRNLAEGNYPTHALINKDEIEVQAFTYRNLNKEDLERALQERGFRLTQEDLRHSVSLRLRVDELNTLASMPQVMYVEPVEGKLKAEGFNGQTHVRANLLSPAPGQGFDGTGVTVALGDIGPLDHLDFHGRFTDLHPGSSSSHGTQVAGVLAGAGNLDPTKVGVAPGTEIYMYNVLDYPHIENAITNYNTLGTVITNTSVGRTYCSGAYETASRELDEDVFALKPLLHIFSSGNLGSGDCGSTYSSISDANGNHYGGITGPRKTAKNSIAVGEVTISDHHMKGSSRGPCDDGRIKPDLVSGGQGQNTTRLENQYGITGGTSMAAPGATGVAAILYQMFRSKYANQDPSSALIKGIMMNTAEDLGRPGPDFDYGYGRVHALRAAEVLNGKTYFTSSVQGEMSNMHPITVPNNVKELRVMLIWIDPEGSTTAAKALVNDLDLTVTDPLSQTLLPLILDHSPNIQSLQSDAVPGVDHLNNVEQVVVKNPAPGSYMANVKGQAITMGTLQEYHLIYTYFTDDLTITFPSQNESITAGSSHFIRWDAYGNSGQFTVEYSNDNGNSWNFLDNVDGHLRHYFWHSPTNTIEKGMFRVTRNGQIAVSSPLQIVRQVENITVEPTVGKSGKVSWDAVPEANNYNVYRLGTKYMELLGTTNSTEFSAGGMDDGEVYWYAVSANDLVSNIHGVRSIAVEYTHIESTCDDCNGTAHATFPYNEGFESGLGLWCQDQSDDYEWNRYFSSNAVLNPGPIMASEGNRYMYLEAVQSPNPWVNTAVLSSSCFDLPAYSNINFQFDFYKSGTPSAVLYFQVTTDNGLNWNTEWSHSIAQSINWHSVSLDLDKYEGQRVLFRFVGATSTTGNGELAIDRIRITTNDILCGDCSDGAWDIFPRTDDFETDDLGLWCQGTNDNFDWTRHSGQTSTLSTGPTAAGSGDFYLYTEADGNSPNQLATLESRCIYLPSNHYIDMFFDYQMNGSDIDYLMVDVTSGNSQAWATTWAAFGDKGIHWYSGVVSLDNFAGGTIKMQITGKTGNGVLSDIAIDNIRFVATPIPRKNVREEAAEDQENDWRLFPNPSHDRFILQAPNLDLNSTFRIMNVLGNDLGQVSPLTISAEKVVFDVSSLTNGSYILNAVSKGEVRSMRFMVVK